MSLNKNNLTIMFPIIGMIVVVTLSNILVQYPINNWLTWGAFTFPIAFLVTDVSNRYFGSIKARKVVYVGFVLAVILSFILADIRIAIASGMAFLFGQLLDIAIFNRLSKIIWWFPPLISSFFASLLDSIIFFSIAFAFLDLPWITWAIGDFAIKVLASLILLLPYRVIVRLLISYPKEAKL